MSDEGASDETKERVRERDGYSCCGCGIDEGAYWIMKQRVLDIHHIDGDRSNNSLSNLITVCRECHRYAQQYVPDCPFEHGSGHAGREQPEPSRKDRRKIRRGSGESSPRKAIQPLLGGGKVTIPKRIRDDFGLKKGDEIEFLIEPVDEIDFGGVTDDE